MLVYQRPFYWYNLTLIPALISNQMHYGLWSLKLFIKSQSEMVAPLKLENVWLIASHTVLGMWLFIQRQPLIWHAGSSHSRVCQDIDSNIQYRLFLRHSNIVAINAFPQYQQTPVRSPKNFVIKTPDTWFFYLFWISTRECFNIQTMNACSFCIRYKRVRILPP